MNATPAQIIKALGGPAETARLCEISTAAVSQWHDNGIPKARLLFLKLARPDVFKQFGEGTAKPRRRKEDRPN